MVGTVVAAAIPSPVVSVVEVGHSPMVGSPKVSPAEVGHSPMNFF
jgi:hypothetical protein